MSSFSSGGLCSLISFKNGFIILKQLLIVYFDPCTVRFSYVGNNTKQHVLQISKLKYKKNIFAFIVSFFLVLFGNKTSSESYIHQLGKACNISAWIQVNLVQNYDQHNYLKVV